MAIFALSGCASRQTLLDEYQECRKANTAPKVDEKGIVSVGKNGAPVMVPIEGSCSEEMEKWTIAEASYERRQEAKKRRASYCGGPNSKLVLMCEGRGVSSCIDRDGYINRSCRCSCVSRHEVRRAMGGIF